MRHVRQTVADVHVEHGETHVEQTGVYFVILFDKLGKVYSGQELMHVLFESNKTGKLLFCMHSVQVVDDDVH